MSKTRHMQARMSQRGIDEALVSLVMDFGQPSADGKVILGRKALEALANHLERLQRDARRALGKGGVVVVEAGSVLVTTYRLSG